jgi:ribosomal protein S18 acetylase RimI-like enzyme
MQYRAQQTSYALNYPYAVNEIIRVDGQRTGRVLTDTSADAVRLIDIALLAVFRGQGIGARLLNELCAAATAAGAPVTLSVRPGNPAQRLYERMGFVVTASDATEIDMEKPAD